MRSIFKFIDRALNKRVPFTSYVAMYSRVRVTADGRIGWERIPGQIDGNCLRTLKGFSAVPGRVFLHNSRSSHDLGGPVCNTPRKHT